MMGRRALAPDPTYDASGTGYRIEIENLSKVFSKDGRDHVVLAGFDFQVEAGEFVSIVGPSGCGKSTLLRMIAGLIDPTSGTINIDGSPVRGPQAGVGLMLQTPTLFPWRSVLRNILLPVEVERRPTEADRAHARALIDLVGLDEFEHHLPRELSGGMEQRAALSRLLIMEPRVMLLDEPFGALDEMTRERLNTELADIVARSGRTVLLVTHSIPEAVYLGDRVLPMALGSGPAAETIRVPLDKPREPSVMNSDAFMRTVIEVRRALGMEV